MADSDEAAAEPTYMRATRASSSRHAMPRLSVSPRSDKPKDAGNPETEAHLGGRKAVHKASSVAVFSPKTIVASGASTVTDLAGPEAAVDADPKKPALRARQYLRFHDAHKDSGDEDSVGIQKSVENMDAGMRKLRRLAEMDGGGAEDATEERWPASWDLPRHSHLKTAIKRNFPRWIRGVSLEEEGVPETAPEMRVEEEAEEEPASEAGPVEEAETEVEAEAQDPWWPDVENLNLHDEPAPERDVELVNEDMGPAATNTRVVGPAADVFDATATADMAHVASETTSFGYPVTGDLEWWNWYRERHARCRAEEKTSHLPYDAGASS
ncbi:hypothetical protein CkaCkLH20_12260 [Colletotrichum karsti]|uniref:Uncharacterized protein n=1 Tax=Colletotrichum karsti TaxID=1095194 RepID=A0A9P6HWL6_9PEZI|nr:uncharacterized protein CkaCkLH20_12260 [Colletotrichum karsti]KAF9870296.1 hypothetical protein CkaCkLH20_12260 [Colletotrichum karsti]